MIEQGVKLDFKVNANIFSDDRYANKAEEVDISKIKKKQEQALSQKETGGISLNANINAGSLFGGNLAPPTYENKKEEKKVESVQPSLFGNLKTDPGLFCKEPKDQPVHSLFANRENNVSTSLFIQ